MTLTENRGTNLHISTKEQFHREYAGEIFDTDFNTEGIIYQRSSGRRQFTQTEIQNRNLIYTYCTTKTSKEHSYTPVTHLKALKRAYNGLGDK